MKSVFYISTAMVALASAAYANDTTCADALSCTVSNQNMGDTSASSVADHSVSNSAMAGNSSASNQSGNSQNANYDNSAMTTQNATTKTGDVNSSSKGNETAVSNDNKSSASVGQVTNGNSSVGNLSTGASTSSSGGNQMNGLGGSSNVGPVTGTNTVGDTSSYAKTGDAFSSSDNKNVSSVGDIGGNSQKVENGSNSTVGNLSTGASNAKIGDIGGNTQKNDSNSVSNAVTGPSTSKVGDLSTGASTSGAISGGNKLGQNTNVQGGDQKVNSALVGGNQAQSQRTVSDASNSGGNSITSVDASTKSSYKAIFIPSVVPGTPPSTVAIGNIIKETTACGPLQAIVKSPVEGTFNGLFRKSKVEQGYTYDLEPYYENGGLKDRFVVVGDDGVTRVYGHQAIIFSTVVGVSGNRNIAIGGGGNQGAWGQGGLGSSSSNTRLVTNIQLKLCELGTVERKVYVEVPVKKISE